VTAAETPRPEMPGAVGEREMLEGWLDFHRATLLVKCDGLDNARLRQRSCPPATLSLLGLVRHMNEVENNWFGHFAGDHRWIYHTEEWPDACFDDLEDADTAEEFAALEQQCARSRQRAAGHGLDETFISAQGYELTLRWIYVHMIEEYARHNGHADLIRQAIDDAVGV
jgi:uncharacterized damage-inducible protein DinB